jgi:hypothetical protein
VMICHTFLGGVTVLCMWVLEQLIDYLGHGRIILIYGRWPLEYLFQTIDLAIAFIIAVFGLWETIEVFRRKRT